MAPFVSLPPTSLAPSLPSLALVKRQHLDRGRFIEKALLFNVVQQLYVSRTATAAPQKSRVGPGSFLQRELSGCAHWDLDCEEEEDEEEEDAEAEDLPLDDAIDILKRRQAHHQSAPVLPPATPLKHAVLAEKDSTSHFSSTMSSTSWGRVTSKESISHRMPSRQRAIK
ncbi:unnamed protein product, partial [Cladocopium goreaui]